MNCRECKAKLKVTHTYQMPGGRTRRSVCLGCGMVYVSQEVFHEAVQGEGAYALAEKLKIVEIPKVLPKRRTRRKRAAKG